MAYLGIVARNVEFARLSIEIRLFSAATRLLHNRIQTLFRSARSDNPTPHAPITRQLSAPPSQRIRVKVKNNSTTIGSEYLRADQFSVSAPAADHSRFPPYPIPHAITL